MRFTTFTLLLVTGCGVLAPVAQVSTDHARDTEPRCAGVTDGSLTSKTRIDSVEPAYSYALGGPNGREARLCGAKIHVAPTDGLTKETLTRTLRCHEARVLLGKTQPTDNDPYALPERWLDIDVEAVDDGFVVQVAAAETVDAQRVLDRARQFTQ